MQTINQTYTILFFLALPFLVMSQQSNVQSLIKDAQEAEAAGSSAGQMLASWLLVYDATQKEAQQQLPEVCVAIAQIYQKEELYEQALPYYLQALNVTNDVIPYTKETQNLYLQLGQTYASMSKPDAEGTFVEPTKTN